MLDKIDRTLQGSLVKGYLKRMLQAFPRVDVIIFGHLHAPCSLHLEGKLLFNPSSPSYPWPSSSLAPLGLLHLEPGKEPQGEIIERV